MRGAVLLVAALLATLAGNFRAQASFYGLPRSLNGPSSWIALAMPTLAPVAHSRFCIEYPRDCRVHKMLFRPAGALALTPARIRELSDINRSVNRSIMPRRNEGGVLSERWVVSPRYGECHDYAVTKRHELLERGWPSRSLLLAEAAIPSGEHHLVLIARTDGGDLVLDNLSGNIKPWSRVPYKWIRVQSPANPSLWSKTG